MDDSLRRQCRGVIGVWIAQLKSGQPLPPTLGGPEFIASLEHLCERLDAEPLVSDIFGEDESYTLELIVAGNPDAGQELLGGLRKWLADARSAVICDPYFLHFRSSKMFAHEEDYVKAVAGIFPKTVKLIDIYATGFTNTVRTKMMHLLKEGRSVRIFDTAGLQDRFIFKDRSEGKVIGTSFGGFGSKFFFTEDLTPADGAEVLAELRALAPFPAQLNRGGTNP